MWKLDINDRMEFTDESFNAVLLVNKPDMRLMLLCMRAGQKVPEHSAAGSITVQAVSGRATFYDGQEACEMCAGTIVRLEAGHLHSVEAHTDTALLVTMIKTPVKAPTEALRQSHADEKRYRDEAISKAQKEYNRLVEKLDKAYEDKLDGNITQDHYNRLSKKWNDEQRNLLDTIERYQQANHLYLEQGIQLLELAQRVPNLYLTKSAREKRKLLDFVLSNSTWKDSNLTTKFRQPFDMLAVTNTTWKAGKAAGCAPDGLSEIWLRR